MSKKSLRLTAQRARNRTRSTSQVDCRLDPAGQATQEKTLIGALCTLALGDCNFLTAADWPPRSIAQLIHGSQCQSIGFGFAVSELSTLLEQGTAALDEAVLSQTGLCFAMVDDQTQSRALFFLESGQLTLSSQRAAAFVDAFLALAAEAYLRGAIDRNGRLGKLH
jgi:hypothetical protein